MTIRILENKNTPRGMEALYAAEAVRQHEARVKREVDRRAAEAERQRQQKENQAEIELQAKKRQKKEAEREREVAATRLDRDLRAAFFAANPTGDESTFKQLLPSLRDDHMRRTTLGSFEGLKAKKRARYSSF